MTANSIQRRYLLSDIRAETRDNGGALMIRGTPIVYNREAVLYENDGFILKEKIAQGAARDALKQAEQVLLWNHDSSMPMAARKNNTLAVREDSFGVHIEADVSGTQWGRDGYEAIKAGVVTQMSFGFYVRSDGQTEERSIENGKRCLKRTIKRFHRIVDFSPVTYPAYADTSISARGYEKLAEEEKQKFSAYKQPEKRAAEKINLEELEKKLKEQTMDKKTKFTEYLRSIKNIRALDTADGMFADTSFSEEIKKKAAQLYPLQSLAYFENVPFGNHNIPIVQNELDVFPIGEKAPAQDTSLSFSQEKMLIKKYGSICKVSNELLFDSSYDVEKLLIDRFSYAMGKYLEKSFINGSGTDSELRGFLRDCVKEEIAGTNIGLADIEKLYSTLHEDYINNSAWLTNKNTYAELLKLKDTAGNLVIHYMDGKPHIYGIPVHITFMPDTHPLALGDFSNYKIIETLSTMQRLNELFAKNGITGFLYERWLDGKLIINDSVIALEKINEEGDE